LLKAGFCIQVESRMERLTVSYDFSLLFNASILSLMESARAWSSPSSSWLRKCISMSAFNKSLIISIIFFFGIFY